MCKCGNTIVTESWSLRAGHTRSCGCIRIEELVDRAHRRKETDSKILAKRRQSRALKEYKRHLRAKYNLTFEQFTEKRTKQKNLCAICSEPMNPPYVDHCHVSGKTRQLLCRTCNLMLGMAADDTEKLRKAIIYLENNNGSI